MYNKNDDNIYDQIIFETIESVKLSIKNSNDLINEEIQDKIINRIEENLIIEKDEIFKMADLTKYQYEIRDKKKNKFNFDIKSYFGLDNNFKDYIF